MNHDPTRVRRRAPVALLLALACAAPLAWALDSTRDCRGFVAGGILVKARRTGDRFELLDAAAHPAGGVALLIVDDIRRGDDDAFVERIDGNGVRTSIAVPLDADNFERPMSLRLDTAGNYYISLNNFGRVPTLSGTEDYHVLKFDAAGNRIWRVQVASAVRSNDFDDMGFTVLADGSVRFASALNTADEVDLSVASVSDAGALVGTQTHRVTQAALGDRVARRVRYAAWDAQGNPHFVLGNREQSRMHGVRMNVADGDVTTFDHVVPNDSEVLERALAVSPNGNVTLVAQDTQVAGDDGVGYVSASFAADGTALWVRRREGEPVQFAFGTGAEHAAADAMSRVFVTGKLGEDGAGCGTVAYDAAGNELWADVFHAAAPGTLGNVTGRRIVPRGDGGAFVIGTAATNLVLEYDASGTLVWSHEFGGDLGAGNQTTPAPDDGVALVLTTDGGVVSIAETFYKKLKKGGIEFRYHGVPDVPLGGIAKVRGKPLNLGTAKANKPIRTKGLKIKNKSRTECLRVEVVTNDDAFDVRPTTVLIPPRGSYLLQIEFDSAGVLLSKPTARLRLLTSDPSSETIDIDLRARVK